jgi:predicted transcriptional regulator
VEEHGWVSRIKKVDRGGVPRWSVLHEVLVSLVKKRGFSSQQLAEEAELPPPRIEEILRGERATTEELGWILLALDEPPSRFWRWASVRAELRELDWTDRSLPEDQRHQSKLAFLGFQEDGQGRSNALATSIEALGFETSELEHATGIPARRLSDILSGEPPTARELDKILSALPQLYARSQRS